ncbi:MAG TPA: carboxymuconolactone decarboxylase family protein, partial [Thermomicrobiales bacterium]|nr:carboxymuconolactone decarboxylase family protein [Thermomicrobiales bacterium]
VPNIYKVLGNNPTILEAAVEHRHKVMDEGELDPNLKEFLAWATVTLLNNQFGIQIHTARLKRLGYTDAQIIEALGVLQYFAGISVVINGLNMGDDVNENVKAFLRGDAGGDG